MPEMRVESDQRVGNKLREPSLYGIPGPSSAGHDGGTVSYLHNTTPVNARDDFLSHWCRNWECSCIDASDNIEFETADVQPDDPVPGFDSLICERLEHQSLAAGNRQDNVEATLGETSSSNLGDSGSGSEPTDAFGQRLCSLPNIMTARPTTMFHDAALSTSPVRPVATKGKSPICPADSARNKPPVKTSKGLHAITTEGPVPQENFVTGPPAPSYLPDPDLTGIFSTIAQPACHMLLEKADQNIRQLVKLYDSGVCLDILREDKSLIHHLMAFRRQLVESCEAQIVSDHPDRTADLIAGTEHYDHELVHVDV